MTITGDLSIDDLCAVLDVDGQTNVFMVDTPPSDLAPDHGPSPTAHVRGINESQCRSTRSAMHDYLTRRLPPRRVRRLEVHMDGCAKCIRVFIDIREASWTRRSPADSSTLTITRAGPTEHLAGTS